MSLKKNTTTDLADIFGQNGLELFQKAANWFRYFRQVDS